MKVDKIQFNIYEGTSATVMAEMRISEGEILSVKLITKVPRGQYYSYLNDALGEAERLFCLLQK